MKKIIDKVNKLYDDLNKDYAFYLNHGFSQFNKFDLLNYIKIIEEINNLLKDKNYDM